MQTYDVILSSPASKSYRCKRAADSLDIDVEKKLTHELKVSADLEAPYNIGLIIGASGSGKTTLAKKMFGADCFKTAIDPERPIIDQFPDSYDYETCAKILAGVGLTAVPCWIRPVKTLSNGQQARAEAALLMCHEDFTVIDEWTSVVDRTVAKVMSHCIQKHARRENRRIVLLSCHYDVVEWLNPDWIIDCNTQAHEDRRSLWRGFQKSEQLRFDIRAVGRETWKYFSKYHYLSENFPGGLNLSFGLFHGGNQIGFVNYSNYVPYRAEYRKQGRRMILHANRIVVHPDYAGAGLGILMTTETARLVHGRGYRVMCKFSSVPIFKAMCKHRSWILKAIERPIKFQKSGSIGRNSGFREKIKTYTFEYAAAA